MIVLLCGDYFFDAFFQPFTGKRQIPAASGADKADIASNAQNPETVRAAGMLLFHFYGVSDGKLRYYHEAPP